MTNLFTKIDIPASDLQIDYKSRLAFFGSCFADNISAQFAARKFNVLANPFGTVYNPLSLARQLKAIADRKVFAKDDVFQDMRLNNSAAPWHCWDAHSSLSAATQEECIAKLNAAANSARDFLQKAETVFITLGTSFVYFLKENGTAGENVSPSRVVANCHRQDPRLFERRMIPVNEVAEAIEEIVESLCKIKNDWTLRSIQDDNKEKGLHHIQDDEKAENREMHIVFTVSPLRHMSDGAHSNTLSKATLQLAVNEVIKKYESSTAKSTPTSSISYFPSYEIVMDELRDYRFYDSDMVHLSKTAEEYIFERMEETYCNEKTRENIRQVERFLKMANHRIQDADSPATAAFLQKLQAEAAKLESQIEGLHLDM